MKIKLPALQQRYSKDQIIEVIQKNYGVLTAICNELDCTYSQFYKYVNKNIEVKEIFAKSKECLVSLAEQKILECLKSEDEKIKLQAAIHTTKSLGKKLGWSGEGNQGQVNIINKENEVKSIFGL